MVTCSLCKSEISKILKFIPNSISLTPDYFVMSDNSVLYFWNYQNAINFFGIHPSPSRS